MKIIRRENLFATDVDLYDSTVEFRQKYLWQKDGSSSLEYKEDDKNMVFYLAFDIVTNNLEGMVGYDTKTNRLRQLVISPKCQGKGIGKILVQNVKNEAKQHLKKKLIVHAWKDSVTFYLKQGFNLIENPYLSKGVWCQKMELNFVN